MRVYHVEFNWYRLYDMTSQSEHTLIEGKNCRGADRLTGFLESTSVVLNEVLACGVTGYSSAALVLTGYPR